MEVCKIKDKIYFLLLILSVFLINNGPTEADSIGSVINVKEFGAVGNGISDDTAAINNAIETAKSSLIKTVYFPAGEYKVSSTLFYYNKLTFVGDGVESTTIKADKNFYSDLFYIRLYYGIIAPKEKYQNNFTIKDLTINGNRDNQNIPVFGIFGYWSDRTTVSNVNVIDVNGIGVGFAGSTNSLVENTNVRDSGATLPGLWCGIDNRTDVGGVENVMFDHVSSINSDLDGIILNCPNSTIQNSRFDNNGLNKGDSGALGAGAIYNDENYKNVRILNNYIGKSTEFGINMVLTDSFISNNTIENQNLAGIYLRPGTGESSKGVTITGNFIRNNAISDTMVAAYPKSGIALDKSSNITITGNIITDDRNVKKQRYGIEQFDSVGVSNNIAISGNVLSPNLTGAENVTSKIHN